MAKTTRPPKRLLTTVCNSCSTRDCLRFNSWSGACSCGYGVPRDVIQTDGVQPCCETRTAGERSAPQRIARSRVPAETHAGRCACPVPTVTPAAAGMPGRHSRCSRRRQQRGFWDSPTGTESAAALRDRHQDWRRQRCRSTTGRPECLAAGAGSGCTGSSTATAAGRENALAPPLTTCVAATTPTPTLPSAPPQSLLGRRSRARVSRSELIDATSDQPTHRRPARTPRSVKSPLPRPGTARRSSGPP